MSSEQARNRKATNGIQVRGVPVKGVGNVVYYSRPNRFAYMLQNCFGEEMGDSLPTGICG